MGLTARERMSIAISRDLKDGEVVLTGAASAVPLAACLLAQARHAPGLTILGAGVYVNPRRLVPEFSAGWDCAPVAIADMSDVFAVTELGIDVMFYGGMQIDRCGSVNLNYVPTAAGVLRGPGLANSALGHTAARTILYTERHDRRTLVEAVDYASVIGLSRGGRSRAELGLPKAGPAALFTPDVLFRPGPGGALVPDRAMSAAAWDEVRARTGWPLPAAPPEPFEADPGEVRTLRRFIDPCGLLAARDPQATVDAGKPS
jgi:glutaconate CoA-transferase subunit B